MSKSKITLKAPSTVAVASSPADGQRANTKPKKAWTGHATVIPRTPQDAASLTLGGTTHDVFTVMARLPKRVRPAEGWDMTWKGGRYRVGNATPPIDSRFPWNLTVQRMGAVPQ